MLQAGFAGLALLAGGIAGGAAAAQEDPLTPYRSVSRVLLVLASRPNDPLVAEQRRIFGALGPGGAERDLVLVEAVDAEPRSEQLRRKYGSGAAFEVVLVGKDGGAKLSGQVPLGADRLFPLIDSMPMRRREMKRQR